MRLKSPNIWRRVLFTYIILAAFGCGGGGGGGGGGGKTGPGDTGNYFPFTVGNTWTYRVTSSTSGAASLKSGAASSMLLSKLLNLTGQYTKRVAVAQASAVNYSTASITGTKVVNGVTVIVYASGIEEDYYLKDSNGITYYGNNDTTDTLTPQLIPYQMVNFPLVAGSSFVQANKTGLDAGEDLDGDGKNDTVDVYSSVTVAGFETVTVPVGTFSDSVRIETNLSITFKSSLGYPSITARGLDTMWVAPGIGIVKETIALTIDSINYNETATYELTGYTVEGQSVSADTTMPMISSTNPSYGATGVAVNSAITATFSEAMDASTINTTTFNVSQGGSNVLGAVTYDATNKVATFSPSVNLSYSTIYTATLTSGVKDLAGNPIAANYTWSFTTGSMPDTTPPTVSSTDPSNGATGVAVNTVITATFSEDMSPSTISITTFTVKDSANNPVSGTVTLSGTTATFTPFTLLALSTTYEATITTGVMDLAGNAMASNYTWSFTTALTAPGALDITFGTGGVVANNPSTISDSARFIAKDSSFMYVAGYDSSPVNTEWRIEKRNLSDGGLVTGFGTNGVVTNNPSGGDDQTKAIAIDSNFMYVVGYDSSPGNTEWRIEKRNLSDGALLIEFGTNGVVTSNPTVFGSDAIGIAIDPTFMYVVGTDGPNFRIEKRYLSDGALVTGFGAGGVASSNPSNTSTAAIAISIDSTYMYVTGEDTVPGNYEWRIEKRNLSDGALVTGFGTNGVVTSDPSVGEDIAYGIAIDSTFMYMVGYQNFGFNWRIEKRNLSDGALVTGFGTNGVVVDNSTNCGNAPSGIAIDPPYMYVVGYDSFPGNAEWRVEKRNLSDGALVTGFGTNGVVTINPSIGADYARDVVIDPTSIYVVGSDSLPGDSEWRIEKRFK